MLQLGFGLVHDSASTGWLSDAFRSFLAIFDNVVYTLISVAYQLIFTISEAQILTGSTIKDFYGRIQLIIGIFMIFKLTISIIQVVVNPELLSDKKKGFGTVITRVVTMLAMFTAIIPLNIPNAKEGSYNAYLNENGLLFGTLYSLQHRILSTNTIEKLILGKDEKYADISNKDGRTKIEKSGDNLAVFILKGFIRINRKSGASSSSNKYVCANNETIGGSGSKFLSFVLGPLMPSDSLSDYKMESLYKAYNSDLITPNLLTDSVTFKCDDGYAFAYFPIASTICGIILVIVLFSFCIDIAIRVFKLAILRLLAPIPILSYVDPQSAEKGTFANYNKILGTTYFELFLRIAIIEFVTVVSQSIMEYGLDLPITNGANIIAILATIIIIVAFFYFCQMAPKFVMNAMGSKGTMSNIGLSGMLAAIGAKATGGNLRDALHAGTRAADAQVEAFKQGKQAPGVIEGFNSGRDYAAQMLTGNEKMTYRQMKRGKGYLANLGITNETADAQKARMYDLKDRAEIARGLADRLNMHGWNGLTDDERGYLENEYRRINGLGTDPLNADQIRDMQNNSGIIAYNDASSKAGKAESKYKDMQAEMQKWGLSDSYASKYKARPNARISEVPGNLGRFFGEVTRDDATIRERVQGVATGVRNIAGAPGNSIGARRPVNRNPHAESVQHQMNVQDRINSDIEDDRRRAS